MDFVVHFCTCSQTVLCDRQFLPVANYCTLLHRENGSFGVLCLKKAVPTLHMANNRVASGAETSLPLGSTPLRP